MLVINISESGIWLHCYHHRTMWQCGIVAETTLKSPGPAYCHVHSAVSVIINIAAAFVVTNSDPDPAKARMKKIFIF